MRLTATTGCLLLLLIAPAVLAQTPPYTLELASGIWVEQIDSTYISENGYTANNSIYKEDNRFIYSYFYLDKRGDKWVQKIVPKANRDREKAWKLVPLQERDSLANNRLQLIVESDLEGVGAETPGYNHTPIRYEYLAPAGSLHFLDRRSLVENWKNIWIQPPAARLFRILALNPFPFIQAPFAVGQQWQWQQEIPSYWGDARWKEWTGTIINTYHYSISKEEILITVFGSLNTLVVEAEAKSSLGSTFLTAYFHPSYGFVKLLYTNIDGSQLLMELIEKE